MNRKLFIITINFIIGILWGLYFNVNIALFVCGICFFILLIKKQRIFAFFVMIIVCATFLSSKAKNKYDHKYVQNQHYSIIGVVENIEHSGEYIIKYTINVKSANDDKSFKNTKLFLKQKLYSTNKNEYEIGNLLKISGTFEFAEKNRNYKGFNYNKYLRAKGVYGFILAENTEIQVLKECDVGFLKKTIYSCRDAVKLRMETFLKPDVADLCKAIIMGEKDDLNEKVITDFNNAGLAHILAISGMHVGYIITIVEFLLKRMDKRAR